jgi:SAM-dependent MidA family methyltransferase
MKRRRTTLMKSISIVRRVLGERLGQYSDKLEFGSLNSLPTLDNGIIFSNELLDTFPVHRITKQNGH